ncbi:MAG: lysine--tRNA ligase [Gammaproteobacteria bacterium]|nr:lysine--tRNA ligase [Gammaproteobacteria bacterium]
MTEHESKDQIAQRRAKLAALRKAGVAYPNDFKRDALALPLHSRFGGKSSSELEAEPVHVKVAGRMMTCRIMGKSAFAHIQDMSGQIQLYLKQDQLPNGRFANFKHWDLGDIVGAEGRLFKTKTGELSVMVREIRLLTKALRPFPEKFHGLTDQETRYRQRYLDLVMNEETRERFRVRHALIVFLRRFLTEQDFVEVETPMMHPIPGGAAARPFITYHNKLDMQLFLRIAPELYLKRLVVGGMEKIFEINRSFRNEGLSTRHNPEFTMLELYQAYADYHDLMDLTEEMLRSLVKEVLGSTTLSYQGEQVDLSERFARMTVKESILKFNPTLAASDLESLDRARAAAKRLEIPLEDHWGLGKIQLEIFEQTVEAHIKEPTFITAFPTEVSPLARRSERDGFVADRFECFVFGRELVNGFSELNDPDDQADRFRQQLKEREAGDESAMEFDEDYICALEYGMPPAAGEGIGIDRLVMVLTDSPSIRDVLLFPQMRSKDSV